MKAASVHTNATMIANGSQVFTKAATLKKKDLFVKIFFLKFHKHKITKVQYFKVLNDVSRWYNLSSAMSDVLLC